MSVLRHSSGKTTRLSFESQLERFLALIRIDESCCWIFEGTKTGAGYGIIWFEGRMELAHRIAYRLWVGPLEKKRGVTIDHVCRIPACVCPEHIEQVAHSDNCLRAHAAIRKGAKRSTVKVPAAKPEQVRERRARAIREAIQASAGIEMPEDWRAVAMLRAQGLSFAAIGARLGFSKQYAFRLARHFVNAVRRRGAA